MIFSQDCLAFQGHISIIYYNFMLSANAFSVISVKILLSVNHVNNKLILFYYSLVHQTVSYKPYEMARKLCNFFQLENEISLIWCKAGTIFS